MMRPGLGLRPRVVIVAPKSLSSNFLRVTAQPT
jgi:hypothetical protein